MKSLTIPLVIYRPASVVAGHGTASIPYLFSQVCLNQIRLSLYQRGLPESLVLSGSVSMKEDPVTAERTYWLGKEELLFRAKVVIKSVRHHTHRRDMYCAELYKPTLLPGPTTAPQAHATEKFRAFTNALRLLNMDFAYRNLQLNIICYDDEEVTLGLKQISGSLSAGNFHAARRQVLDGLSTYGYTVRMYDYGVRIDEVRRPAEARRL